jgi:hypothetical protein
MINKSVIEQNNNSMIAQLRSIRDKISLEVSHLSKEKRVAYFSKINQKIDNKLISKLFKK